MNDLQVSREKKLTLLLLCWLFGLLGIHRFYTHKYLTGAAQLLILGVAVVLALLEVDGSNPFVILVLASVLLWWVIDALLIIMGKFTDKEGKPIVDWV